MSSYSTSKIPYCSWLGSCRSSCQGRHCPIDPEISCKGPSSAFLQTANRRITIPQPHPEKTILIGHTAASLPVISVVLANIEWWLRDECWQPSFAGSCNPQGNNHITQLHMQLVARQRDSRACHDPAWSSARLAVAGTTARHSWQSAGRVSIVPPLESRVLPRNEPRPTQYPRSGCLFINESLQTALDGNCPGDVYRR